MDMSDPSTDVRQDSGSDVKDALRESGSDVKDTLLTSGSDVKDAATTTASQIKDQATEQVRSVADTAMEQTKQTASSFAQGLEYEANEQSLRIAALLDDLGGELDEMSQNGSGWASAFVGDAAGRTRDLARWMEQTEPREMLGAVEDFARRRPGVFIFGSALAGVVVGRLTRGMIASNGGTASKPAQLTSSPGGSGYRSDAIGGRGRSDIDLTPSGMSRAPQGRVYGTNGESAPISPSGFEEAQA